MLVAPGTPPGDQIVEISIQSPDVRDERARELLRKADQAVYHAKREGRNVTRLSRAA